MSAFPRVALVLSALLCPFLSDGASRYFLDGVWKSEGYGYVLEIRGARLKAFEVTASTCVPSFTARVQRAASFKTNENDLIFFRLIESIEGSGELLFHFDGAASEIRLKRLPELPLICATPTGNTPFDIFDVFTKTFSEHYIGFDLRNVTWNETVALYRSKITPQTSPAQLFDILTAMLEPLHDAHTGLFAPTLKREFEGFRPGGVQLTEGKAENRFKKRVMPKLFRVTEKAYLDAAPKRYCNGQLQYAHIGKTTGYLRILAEGDYTSRGGPGAQLSVLNRALDEIFADPTLGALVLDLRINFGGSDQLSLAIASRLVNMEYTAFTKFARLGFEDLGQWTAGKDIPLKPTTRPSFHGPVVELIGPLTMSAGETFTQALMARKPAITKIGENTQGVFSDVLERHLPNHWTFALPNEVFRTQDGTAFDVIGIPPDVRVPVFATDDVRAGLDPGLARALQLLGRKSH